MNKITVVVNNEDDLDEVIEIIQANGVTNWAGTGGNDLDVFCIDAAQKQKIITALKQKLGSKLEDIQDQDKDRSSVGESFKARLQQLSGRNPNDDTVKVLQQEAQRVQEAYTVTIDALKNNRQIDEGLFTNLTAAIKTVGQIGKNGAASVVDKAKKLGAAVKTIYTDKKAQLELKKLLNTMRTAIYGFDKMEGEAPTILAKDAEVKKALAVFRDLFTKTIDLLSARAAVQEGIELTPAGIEKFLAEQLDEQVVISKAFSKPVEINIDNAGLKVTYICKNGEDLMKITSAVAHIKE